MRCVIVFGQEAIINIPPPCATDRSFDRFFFGRLLMKATAFTALLCEFTRYYASMSVTLLHARDRIPSFIIKHGLLCEYKSRIYVISIIGRVEAMIYVAFEALQGWSGPTRSDPWESQPHKGHLTSKLMSRRSPS